MNIIDFDKKECKCCDMVFKLNSDLNRHIKTSKHTKNQFNLDKSQCPFCIYKTKDLSDMNKHIKKQHSESKLKIETKIEKEFKESKIPNNIIKLYLTLLESQSTLAIKISALKCRYRRLKNRNYKLDEYIMIETKELHSEAIQNYKNNKLKIDEMLMVYPNLVHENIPSKKIDSDDDSDDDEEYMEEIKLSLLAKQEQTKKFDKINKIKDEIEELIQQYKESKGDKSIQKRILDKESELTKLY